MFKFKDDKDITHMWFIKAKINGAMVKMYVTADTNDALKKLTKYRSEGYDVYGAMKPIQKMNTKGKIIYD